MLEYQRPREQAFHSSTGVVDSLTLVWPLQVDADTDIGTLQAILEAETGLPVEQQAVFHNGKLLPSRYGAVLLLSVGSGWQGGIDLVCFVLAAAHFRQHRYRTTTC